MSKIIIDILIRLAGVAVLFFAGKRDGKNQVKLEQSEKAAQDAQARIDIQDQLNAMSDDDRRRMLDKWASGVQRVVPDKTDK